jgi:succinyl-diaminopimelate desuccinylase
MTKKILPLAKKLIRIRSTSGNRKALEGALDLSLRQVREYPRERFEDGGVKSALVYNTKSRPRKFRLLINVHLDVMEYKDHQFIPRVNNGMLYGAGALDMKASAACLITVFKDVARMADYPVGLQLVTDEETGGFHGTKYQITKGVRADFVLAGEPTNFDIVNKAKGVLLLNVLAKGVAAHGAYPWKGENAILKMSSFLQSLQKRYPISKSGSWTTTINVGTIETKNRALNKIPDDCSASLDVRYIPEDSKFIIKNIRKLLPHGFAMEMIANEPPLFTNPNRYVDYLKEVGRKNIGRVIILRGAHGTSDARHFSKVNCPGIEFGPVGGDIGGDKEWVDISSLERNYKIIKDFILLVGKKGGYGHAA